MEGHVLFTFSNGGELSDERVFLQANHIPHLVKPFEVAELIAQARRLLQKAQAATAGLN
jgi:DNA-binding response OmpR family regulator